MASLKEAERALAQYSNGSGSIPFYFSSLRIKNQVITITVARSSYLLSFLLSVLKIRPIIALNPVDLDDNVPEQVSEIKRESSCIIPLSSSRLLVEDILQWIGRTKNFFVHNPDLVVLKDSTISTIEGFLIFAGLIDTFQSSPNSIIGSSPPDSLPALWTSCAGGRPALTRIYLDHFSRECKTLSYYTISPTLVDVYLGKHPPPDFLFLYECLLRGVTIEKPSIVGNIESLEQMEYLINNTEYSNLYRTAPIPSLKNWFKYAPAGRLALLREYGGKQRIFAIPPASVQVTLKPIHDRLMELLGSLPSDYTMDQNRFRIDQVRGK